MKIIEEYTFDTFFEFVRQFSSILFPKSSRFVRDRYIFRGQGSSEYGLKSSFDRTFAHLPIMERISKYKKLIEYLREEVRWMHDVNLGEAELIELAQHHGMPTRLLDWSSSPLIAAYFAFNERVRKLSPGRYVSIWAVDQTNTTVWNKSLGIEIRRIEDKSNDRALRQSGYVSIISTPHDSIEAFVHSLHPKKTVLWRFNIFAEDAQNAFAFLDTCNIRATSLFGQIDGALNTALECLYSDS